MPKHNDAENNPKEEAQRKTVNRKRNSPDRRKARARQPTRRSVASSSSFWLIWAPRLGLVLTTLSHLFANWQNTWFLVLTLLLATWVGLQNIFAKVKHRAGRLVLSVLLVVAVILGGAWANRAGRPARVSPAYIPFSSTNADVTVVFGNNQFSWNREHFRDGPKRLPVPASTYTNWQWSLGLDGEALYLNARITGPDGSEIIRIEKNVVVTEAPHRWDMNSNSNSIEVVDEHLVPRFQLLRKSDTMFVMNAALADSTGRFWFVSEEGGVSNVDGTFRRVFRYPAWKYPGRLLEE